MRLGGLFPAGWAEDTDAAATATYERLEAELATARAGTAKDAVRAAFLGLGDLQHQRGDLHGALKNFQRVRDYSSSQRQTAGDCLKVAAVALEYGNTALASNHLAKAEVFLGGASGLAAGGGGPDGCSGAQLAACAALMHLKNKAYRLAALKFAEVDCGELGGSLSGLLAVEDVALYGALCGLAELDRDELKRCVLEGKHGLLDLVPAVRSLVRDLHECRFAPALACLDALKGSLLLDVHLAPHALHLLGAIRDRCAIMYFEPFLSVSLASMASALGCSVPEMEAHAARLVMDDKIAARIDSEAKTLHMRTEEARSATYRKVAKLGDAHLGEMRLLLLRMSCVEHGLVVRSRPAGGASMAGVYGPVSGAAWGQQDERFVDYQDGYEYEGEMEDDI